MTKNTSVNVVSASLASDVVDSIQTSISTSDFSAIDFSRCVVLPGFCDVHVHLREPGFSYKETIASGSLASASVTPTREELEATSNSCRS